MIIRLNSEIYIISTRIIPSTATGHQLMLWYHHPQWRGDLSVPSHRELTSLSCLGTTPRLMLQRWTVSYFKASPGNKPQDTRTLTCRSLVQLTSRRKPCFQALLAAHLLPCGQTTNRFLGRTTKTTLKKLAAVSILPNDNGYTAFLIAANNSNNCLIWKLHNKRWWKPASKYWFAFSSFFFFYFLHHSPLFPSAEDEAMNK